MNKSITVIALLLVVVSGNYAELADTTPGVSPNVHIIPDNPELTREAIDYYQKLAAPLQKFKEANYNYARAVTRIRRIRKIEKSRQEQLKAITSISAVMKQSNPLHGDDTLRSEILRYLDMSFIVLKQDFDKILDMEDIEAQSYDQEEAHQLALDLAMEKLKKTFGIMRDAEKAFFKKYQINVTETKDEMSLKIEKANKAIEYYNAFYRIFFKVNKQDNYARKSLAEKDVAALEQHLGTLVSFAEEAAENLKGLAGYEGDDGLLKVVTAAVEFYHNEGVKTYPANIEYFLKVDSFQNRSKKMNALRESERTRKVVDEYNKAVNEYNKSGAEINKINAASYKQQKRIVANWNKEVDRFFRKHS
jgi:hypothetical protein